MTMKLFRLSKIVARSANTSFRHHSDLAVQSTATLWNQLDSKRTELSNILEDAKQVGEADLTNIRFETTKQNADIKKAKDLKALFWSKKFTSLKELITFYEQLIHPVHALRDEVYTTWVDQCGYLSQIKQSVNASAEEMKNWTAEFDKLGEHMKQLEEKKLAYVASTFDVEIYNYILNVLRIGAEQSPGCLPVANQIFHDMTENEIEFNETTKLLLKNIQFGDSIYDNSDLLFSHIEYPERGDHTYQPTENLRDSCSRMLETIESRHSLPMEVGDLRQEDEFFMLCPPEPAVEEAEEAQAIQ
eukprot:TRINITY_DN7531_c2_g1_i1.p2 TRINITY_DN7531_c2_g1~~TRINITY_DN7531_c2_g1_i1.p2  ORF type:complete len:302 (+),score=56.24 TRINITY_DN7531_c2_g1_i1:50-955(+)